MCHLKYLGSTLRGLKARGIVSPDITFERHHFGCCVELDCNREREKTKIYLKRVSREERMLAWIKLKSNGNNEQSSDLEYILR